MEEGKHNFFMSQKNVLDVRVHLGAPCIRSRHATDQATMPGVIVLTLFSLMLRAFSIAAYISVVFDLATVRSLADRNTSVIIVIT